MSLVRSRQCIVWSLGRSRRMISYDEMALTIAGKEFEKICSHAEEPHLSENWLTQQGKIMVCRRHKDAKRDVLHVISISL